MGRFFGKQALVIGLGISGKSAASFLLDRGAFVVGCDRNEALPSSDPEVSALCQRGLTFTSEGRMKSAQGFDCVVLSPGVPPSHPCCATARELGIEVIGEIELACREISQKCVGVTGTNGKTTVTLLVEHVLKESGRNAKALGNVGTPLTSAISHSGMCKEEMLVIELSSFQLDTLESVFLDAAVLLNITPDHLDRYGTMEAYAASKIAIGGRIKPGGAFFVEEKCYRDFMPLFPMMKVQLYGYSDKCGIYTDMKSLFSNGARVCALPETLQGKRSHDVENFMAAYALCSVAGVSAEQFVNAYATFKKPSHRIEHVRTVSGIQFYDDSKGTNVDAVIRAVERFDGGVVLIAGGVDKGFPYSSWADAFKGKVKAIFAIGQAKDRIRSDLEDRIPVSLFADMQQAVIAAATIARKGDTVLLSPGCSSYDMFKDYAHRGREFQRIVNSIVSLG